MRTIHTTHHNNCQNKTSEREKMKIKILKRVRKVSGKGDETTSISRPKRRGMVIQLALMLMSAMVLFAQGVVAADPGLSYPPASEMSDQKTGSILFFNLYTSQGTSPNVENTRINITNTSPTAPVIVHLFFVEGSSCSIADRFACLTKSQTLTMLASDVAPTETGYLMVVAVDSLTGCPMSFNRLTGDEYIKLASGHSASLPAQAFSSLEEEGSVSQTCSSTSTQAFLDFDGVNYNRVPRALAMASVPAIADGNDTRLVVNRVGGSFLTGASTIGGIQGLVYDDVEVSYSWVLSDPGCQLLRRITTDFPKTAPRIDSTITAGRTGWLKFWSTRVDNNGIVGAFLNYNSNLSTAKGAFNGGHNLTVLTFSDFNRVIIPVFPPSC